LQITYEPVKKFYANQSNFYQNGWQELIVEKFSQSKL